jgi:hypothetical protein
VNVKIAWPELLDALVEQFHAGVVQREATEDTAEQLEAMARAIRKRHHLQMAPICGRQHKHIPGEGGKCTRLPKHAGDHASVHFSGGRGTWGTRTPNAD